MSVPVIKNFVLSSVYERLKAHKADMNGGAIESDFWSGYHSAMTAVLEIVRDEAERSSPAPKPHKAPQLTPCVSVDGVETMEEIT
jgi:hypothetical protein